MISQPLHEHVNSEMLIVIGTVSIVAVGGGAEQVSFGTRPPPSWPSLLKLRPRLEDLVLELACEVACGHEAELLALRGPRTRSRGESACDRCQPSRQGVLAI